MAKVEELKKQVLFEDLNKQHLGYLAEIVEDISLKKGQALFKEGEDTKGIYLVRRGAIEVSKTTPDGWKQKLAIIKAGQFLGELSVMEKRRHEASATALEKTDLTLLTKDAFEQMEKQKPKIALAITKKIAIAMSMNLRRMNEKFLDALINY
ncbi:MAG: cyclic nucleotide-binding domain-containing protein [Nitrospirota bacterium]|jgi:CRP/FNR family transcriptional regulator